MTQVNHSPVTVGSSRDMNFAEAINDALDVALGLDPRVFLLGEDIADPTGGVRKLTQGLSTKYGSHRVRNTPIAEQSIVGAAIGAAIAGLRPVAEIMLMDFTAVAMDQLVNHAAKFRYMSGGRTNVPLTIHTRVGPPGRAQHSSSVEGWFMQTPGLKVVYPASSLEAKGLLLSCIFADDPCLFIESSKLFSQPRELVPEGDYRVPIGVARTVR